MTKRIVIAGCAQEVSTFNPVFSTYEDFNVAFGQNVIEKSLGKNSEVAGMVEVLGAAGGFEVVGAYSAGA
ncbi:MAG TPA: microcystin LR degradation protein MlrC, partial [Dehalococcoidia bacterium]|nr:microcystin LR degradation protein MlrC [Dehalococcoidia bacterium]